MAVKLKKILLCTLLCLPIFITINPNAFAFQKDKLRIGIITEPTSLDPHFQNTSLNQAFRWHIFDTLVSFDDQYRIRPGLAKSWSLEDDYRTWVFRLREGVKFHDGREFSADDVFFSVNRVGKIKHGYGFPRLSEFYKMEVIGKYTIRITTPVPNPWLLYELAGLAIISKKVGHDVSPRDFASGKAAIGTGPYKFVEWIRKVRLILRRNDEYWGEKFPWSRLEIRPIPDSNAQAAALSTGDLDVAMRIKIKLKKLTDMRKYIIDTITGPRNRVSYLFLNVGSKWSRQPEQTKILQNSRVRAAIAQAIDRNSIVRDLGITNALPAGQFVPEGMFGFDPDLAKDPYNPEKAKKLLAEAGYPNGFKLTIYAPERDIIVLEMISNMLSKVGIRTNIKLLRPSTYFVQSRTGELSAGLSIYRGGPDFAFSGLRDIFHSFDPKYGLGMRNYGRYTNPELDSLIFKALISFDQEKRNSLTKQAMNLAIKDYPVIPLYNYGDVYAVRKKYEFKRGAKKYISHVSIGETSGYMLAAANRYEPKDEFRPLPPPAPPKLREGPSASEEIAGPRSKIKELLWNSWSEEYQSTRQYAPVSRLKPDTEYRIALDLSAIAYARDKKGIIARPAGKDIRNALEKLIGLTLPYTDFTVLLLYDPTYFEPSGDKSAEAKKRENPMRVELNKIRKAYRKGIKKYDPGDVLEILKTQGNSADFVFGFVDFRLKTRSQLPAGRASIAFSIWDNSGRPVDEVVVGFCTDQGPCPKPSSVRFGFCGTDTISASDTESGIPDAAVHFIEFESGEVHGVLRLNNSKIEPKLVDWLVDLNADNLKNKLLNKTKKLLQAKDEEWRHAYGRSLYSALFPDKKNKRTKTARKMFENFIAGNQHVSSRRQFPDKPASIFVRLAARNLALPTLLPFSMMSVGSRGNDVYVGNYFRIETPLPIQSYRAEPECLINWVMTQPISADPSDKDLIKALKKMPDRVLGPEGAKRRYRFRFKGTHGAKLIHKMKLARDWFEPEDSEAPTPPTLLSLLCHHDSEKLFFVPGSGEWVDYGLIKRAFDKPSAAILNGCSTGNYGAANLIQTINELGIQAVIATHTGVPGDLAGDFLECFISEAEKMPDEGAKLFDIFYNAMRCLNNRDTGYGGQILWYTLLGNGNLRLCKPKSE